MLNKCSLVSGIDDEDSCPPDLEEVSESVQAQPELDNDVAAAAPAIEFNQNIVRELTLAIKVSHHKRMLFRFSMLISLPTLQPMLLKLSLQWRCHDFEKT